MNVPFLLSCELIGRWCWLRAKRAVVSTNEFQGGMKVYFHMDNSAITCVEHIFLLLGVQCFLGSAFDRFFLRCARIGMKSLRA